MTTVVPGILYIVATPIGNLADISARARDTLSAVSRIAAEDTRHTAQLLRALGLEKPLLSLHEHNERERTAALVGDLLNGNSLALVSDAGTPLVADPGFALVRAAQRNDCPRQNPAYRPTPAFEPLVPGVRHGSGP